jgi:large subunit ribosomal protein L22
METNEVVAITRNIRMSASKSLDLGRSIQGKGIAEALAILQFNERKGARQMLKTLKSAIANAENNANLDVDDLKVKLAVVEVGPTLKRGNFGGRGQFKPMVRRTCHFRVVLAVKAVKAKKSQP